MKTKEELNALKEEFEILNKKLAGLTEEELEQVTGGAEYIPPRDIFFVKGTSSNDGTHGPTKRLTDAEPGQNSGGSLSPDDGRARGRDL